MTKRRKRCFSSDSPELKMTVLRHTKIEGEDRSTHISRRGRIPLTENFSFGHPFRHSKSTSPCGHWMFIYWMGFNSGSSEWLSRCTNETHEHPFRSNLKLISNSITMFSFLITTRKSQSSKFELKQHLPLPVQQRAGSSSRQTFPTILPL